MTVPRHKLPQVTSVLLFDWLLARSHKGRLKLISVNALQAAQVRKSSFVPEGRVVKTNGYHPDTHHTCTVHAGTFVQQVSQV